MDKTYFNEMWLNSSKHPELSMWISRVESNRNQACCNLCKKKIELSNMGKRALLSHMKGKTHQSLAKEKLSQTSLLRNFLQKNNPITESSSENTPSTSSASTSSGSKSITEPQSMHNYLLKDDVTTTEIIWAHQIIKANMSLNSCEKIGDIFRRMFPDSQIAGKFQMGKTKCSYIVNHGLAPHYNNLLICKLKECDNFVISFDEALNKVTQKTQMDAYVRYFDKNKSEVSSQYLGSTYLGHTRADDLLAGFKCLIKPLKLNNLLQVSMDGPNVNLSFLKKLQDEIKSQFPEGKQLLNIGVCGLHVVNGALKTGLMSVKWNLQLFLRDCYYIFNDSPARRADYCNITKSSKFPLKYCSTRWTENVKCIDRILDVYDNIKLYIENGTLPKTKPVTEVKEAMKDHFLKTKLAFFRLISTILEPFLIKFQTSEPLIPYLNSDLLDIIKNLMSYFIKTTKLTSISYSKLCNLDLESNTNLLEARNINVGFGAKKFLPPHVDALTFKLECRKLLQQMVSKLLERSPLKYNLVSGLTSLDPEIIKDYPSTAIKRMDIVLENLHLANRITDKCAEKAKMQYQSLTEKAKTTFANNFNEFCGNSGNMRIDTFYFQMLEKNTSFQDLWKIIKMCLLFSHGNASVESGFSINKALLIENLLEESLTSQRSVYDAIIYYEGIENIPITKALISSVRAARSRYEQYLLKKRHMHEKEEESQSKCRKIDVEVKKLVREKEQVCIKKLLEEEELTNKIKELERYKATLK